MDGNIINAICAGVTVGCACLAWYQAQRIKAYKKQVAALAERCRAYKRKETALLKEIREGAVIDWWIAECYRDRRADESRKQSVIISNLKKEVERRARKESV